MPEELGFELSPEVEDLELSEDYVRELIDQDIIGEPSSYGFDSFDELYEEFVSSVLGSDDYDVMQLDEETRWKQFANDFDEAGGVIYNPENTDQYYTDKTSLSAEDIE